MSSSMQVREENMYCTYEDLGTVDEKITIVRMYPNGEHIEFKEAIV